MGQASINKRLIWKAALEKAEEVRTTPSVLCVIIMAVQCWFKYLFYSKSDRVSLSYASSPVEMSGLISLTFSYTHRYHTGGHAYSRPHACTHQGMWSSLWPCCLSRVQKNSPRLRQHLSNLMSVKPAPPTKEEQPVFLFFSSFFSSSFYFYPYSSDKGQIQITKLCKNETTHIPQGEVIMWISDHVRWFGGFVSIGATIVYTANNSEQDKI